MKIFTIENGTVSDGASVEKLSLKNAGIEIPAIIIGEDGRGRQRGVLPVQLSNGQYKEWQGKGIVKINFADLTTTKAGKSKLIAKETTDETEKIVVVFLTKIGFRGGNSHTGDRSGKNENGDIIFSDFPGEIIASGTIAQGTAGRMGSGDQLVAIIPKDVIFRTSYSGRLYGSPSSHYYKWDGEKILGGFTWDERCVSEIF